MADLTRDELWVGPLELLVDLVFACSITQMARLLADDSVTEELNGALLVVLLVCGARSQYPWALDSIGDDATPPKSALLAASWRFLIIENLPQDRGGR